MEPYLDRIAWLMKVAMMDRINSTAHGIWHLMIVRGQGHLAHHILSRAFILVEWLRSCPTVLWETDSQQFGDFRKTMFPYANVLDDCISFATSSHMSRDFVRKMRDHKDWLCNIGHRQPPSTPNLEEYDIIPKVNTPQEQQQCTNAASQDATSPQSRGLSPAGNIGSASASSQGINSEAFSGATEKVPSEPQPSGVSSSGSSSRKKPLRGRGHPKRPNPYTKPKKGNR